MPNAIPPSSTCQVTKDKAGLPFGGTSYVFRGESCKQQSGPRIHIIGDSHAGSYQRLSAKVARETGKQVSIITASGCAVIPGSAQSAACSSFLSSALSTLPKDLGRVDFIFLPGLRTPRYRENSDAKFSTPSPAPNYSDVMIAEQAHQISKVLDTGARVVIELPKPVYRYAPLRCSDWFNAHNPNCQVPPVTKAEALAWREPMVRILQRLQVMEPRLETWDPFPILCPDEICLAMDNGRPLVSDGDHLSGYGNDVLFDSFLKLIRSRENAQIGPRAK